MPPDDLSRRLDEVRWSTERLLAALRHPPRDEAYLARPSLLPGWTRAHVLGHLACNADALVRTLEGTRRGDRVPMYAGEAERAADIEAASRLAPADLLDEVTASAERLERTWSRMTPVDWESEAVTRTGPQPARRLIGARWREVEIHRVDLDDGYGPGDWPASFVAPLLPSLLDPERLGPRLPPGLSVEVVNTDSGQRWSVYGGPAGVAARTPAVRGTGRPGRGVRPAPAGARPVRVVGPSWALVGWLLGRVAVVRAELDGEPPELGPWL
ncbi:MAG TPA: maleylpyruvate isomerase N-terminal domain-containing protein [Mycobacteriales bacterium]|nr:maleylpyruvate isomerase N-terminal domain-containing protein [Mycobacteriales bacterium]